MLSDSRWRRIIKDRDGWHCANINKFPQLQHELFEINVHHIWPKKLGGTNLSSNGIVYCRACHAAEHPEYQQKFMSIFKLQTIAIFDLIKRIWGSKPNLKYYRLLKFLTGSLEFRGNQLKIIQSIVEGNKHVFAVMPTGSGKSILYQIPGLLDTKYPSLVISPLKALQFDQVRSLEKHWVPATRT